MKNSPDSLPRRRNPIPRREMAAKLASEDELSPERSEIPPPFPTLRRTSLPELSKSPSHFSPPENPRSVRRRRNPIPRRHNLIARRRYLIPRRQMGAKLADEDELSPEKPTPPPFPTRKTLDLVSSSQAALPVPAGGSTVRQRCEGGRRLPRYYYRVLPCSLNPIDGSTSLSSVKSSEDGAVAAGSSEAAPLADRFNTS